MNKVILLGNLTKNPELRPVGNTQVCKLGLAVNRKFKDKDGNLQEEVCFIDINTWGATATFCEKYLKKGMPLLVEGRLKFESWEKDGKTNSRHTITAERVELLGFKGKDQENEVLAVRDLSLRDLSQRDTSQRDSSQRVKTQREVMNPNDYVDFSTDDNLPF